MERILVSGLRGATNQHAQIDQMDRDMPDAAKACMRHLGLKGFVRWMRSTEHCISAGADT